MNNDVKASRDVTSDVETIARLLLDVIPTNHVIYEEHLQSRLEEHPQAMPGIDLEHIRLALLLLINIDKVVMRHGGYIRSRQPN